MFEQLALTDTAAFGLREKTWRFKGEYFTFHQMIVSS